MSRKPIIIACVASAIAAGLFSACCVGSGIWFFNDHVLYPERALIRQHVSASSNIDPSEFTFSEWSTTRFQDGSKRVKVRVKFRYLGTTFSSIEEYEVRNGKVTRIYESDRPPSLP